MGLFSKDKSDYMFTVSTFYLRETHLKVLLAKTLSYGLGELGYTITTVNLSSDEAIEKWLAESRYDFNPHWALSPTGTIDMSITTDPPRCKVKLKIPDLESLGFERLVTFINDYSENTLGNGKVTVKR